MKRRLTLTLYTLLTFFTLLQGQSAWPPAYAIESDTAYTQILDPSFWQTLEDKAGSWTIREVSSPPLSEKFHAKGIKADGIDTLDVHTFWQRYRLKNTMTKEARFSLISYSEYFDVYIFAEDSLQHHYKSGFLSAWDQRDGLKAASEGSSIMPGSIPIYLAPGEEITVYDRRHRSDLTNFAINVRILNTDSLVLHNYINYVEGRTHYFSSLHLQEAFVIGVLFVTMFLSLFFYRYVREKVYLNFALFAFFLSINRTSNIIHDYARWNHPAFVEFTHMTGYAWCFIPFFLINFFRNYLDIRRERPMLDKTLYGVALVNLLIGLVGISIEMFSGQRVEILGAAQGTLALTITPVLLLITQILCFNQKDKSIRYLIIGSFPLLLLYSLTTLFNLVDDGNRQQATGLGIYFRLMEVICIAWLVLSFILILTMRFERLRKENAEKQLANERLAKEREIERNELIEKQKRELETQVTDRTADLQKSLHDLQSTQNQLIQSEKMASLGELTAGIAHEIQNPLNFVNNFSEVNTELIDEMNHEIDKGNLPEVKTIANDIKENQQKITEHGKRADAIVKGMLQHSRSSSGVKEPTDINALADEYLRLAYHGLRAKDKSFNAIMKTDYDPSIGLVNLVPQDIGRVILNLITNAFYAVSTLAPKSPKGDLNYEPTVTISTRLLKSPLGDLGANQGSRVEISVSDNGPGIPKSALDKIFQPFFTTKPTGKGTGLGLSLSYDIVKAHGGELKVETKEGEGSVFTILIPVS
jgi:two-component system NtrC family sensor kinase